MNRAPSQAKPEDGFVEIFMSMMGSAPMNKRTKLDFGVRAMAFFVMFSWLPLNVARAQASEPAQVDKASAQRAKQHFAVGEEHFKSRRFDEALAEYERGYAETPSPVFTFNMAQCQRLLGHSSAAIELYRRYLQEAPEGLGRAVAEQRIAELTADHPSPGAGTSLPTAAATDVAPAAATDEVPATIGGAPIVANANPLVASAPPPAPPEPAAPTAAPPRLFEPAPIPREAGPAVTASAPTDQLDRPIYRRWWFWAAAAAAVASGSIIAIAASSSSRPGCDPDRVCK
jgi:hypothetical protein